MNRLPFARRIRSFFLDPLRPNAVFHLDPRYLCGLSCSPKTGRIKARFAHPLPSGLLRMSFDRPNIAEPGPLKRMIEEGVKTLKVRGGRAALLVPDPSARVFILNVESVPSSDRERAEFVRWRISKHVPLHHEDIRIDSRIVPSGNGAKIIAVMVRESVVREYESLFEGIPLKVGAVSLPSFGLVNLLAVRDSSTAILVNIEEFYLSFLALSGRDWSLYRQKGVVPGGGPETAFDQKIDQLVQEIQNTVYFLEDKEKRRVDFLWVRCGLLEGGAEIVDRLRDKLPYSVRGFDGLVGQKWDAGEKNLFAPLVGQIR
jgi:hypothetical protein